LVKPVIKRWCKRDLLISGPGICGGCNLVANTLFSVNRFLLLTFKLKHSPLRKTYLSIIWFMNKHDCSSLKYFPHHPVISYLYAGEILSLEILTQNLTLVRRRAVVISVYYIEISLLFLSLPWLQNKLVWRRFNEIYPRTTNPFGGWLHPA
jgi:hypothetical protein